MNNRGFSLIELLVVISIIGILAVIAIPGYRSLKAKGYNAQARSSGTQMEMAEETYFGDRTANSGGYTDNFGVLSRYDKEILQSPQVTFRFLAANYSGYTFITEHAWGTEAYTFKQYRN